MTAKGVLTVADLYSRCEVDRITGCWHWKGAVSSDGCPRIWTLDYRRVEKRSMSGPLAVWNIAHKAAPTDGFLVFRRCQTTDCCCPVHLGLARSKAEIGTHVKRMGNRKGTCLPQRRANIAKAIEALGIKVTPSHVVQAIRLAGPEVSNIQLAEEHGIKHTTVSKIRRGDRHAEVKA
jgi:hypothetical protein